MNSRVKHREVGPTQVDVDVCIAVVIAKAYHLEECRSVTSQKLGHYCIAMGHGHLKSLHKSKILKKSLRRAWRAPAGGPRQMAGPCQLPRAASWPGACLRLPLLLLLLLVVLRQGQALPLTHHLRLRHLFILLLIFLHPLLPPPLLPGRRRR